MTNHQITRWTKDHMREFTQPVNGWRVVTFKLSGELVQVSIQESSWQWALKDYQRMNELRRVVRERALREGGKD